MKLLAVILAVLTAAAGKDPLVTRDHWIGTAEAAWHKLERDPADSGARADYRKPSPKWIGS